MTPAERVILRVLADEHRRRRPGGAAYGPYGRAARRLSIDAQRVWEVEYRYVPWPSDSDASRAATIEARLA